MKQETKFKDTEIGLIPDGWEVYSLSELYEFGSGLSKSKNDFGFGYPFLSYKDIFDNFFVPEHLGSLANTTKKERMNCSVKRGDVFLTRTSETAGEIGVSCVALRDYPNTTFNGFTKRLRPKNKEKTYPEFEGYYFRDKRFRNHVISMCTLTTRASLNNEILGKLKITLPPFKIQVQIASILKPLDDKIYLLQKQNKTLEAIAQALFKHWFVDFEFSNEEGKPYKSSGGEMGFNEELGKEIPKEWKILKLKDIIERKKFSIVDGPFGTQLHSDEYVSEGIPVIRIINLSFEGRFIKEGLVFITGEKFNSLIRSAVYPGDILLAKTGATIGKMSMLPESIDKALIASSVLKISPDKNKKNKYFIFNIIKKLSKLNYWEGVSGGSTRPTINLSDAREIDLVYPIDEVIMQYHNIVDSMYKSLQSNEQEIYFLSQIRDCLLPKLMSGKIRVPVEVE